jgi:hypothetical protein
VRDGRRRPNQARPVDAAPGVEQPRELSEIDVLPVQLHYRPLVGAAPRLSPAEGRFGCPRRRLDGDRREIGAHPR